MASGVFISTTTQQIAHNLVISKNSDKTKFADRIKIDLGKKSNRKRVVRYGFVATNMAILLVVAGFVIYQPSSTDLSGTSVVKSATTSTSVNPLDQVSSADIALTVARMGSLPESTAINNQAESQAITASSSTASASMVAKPQVVTAGLKSNADIQSYKTVAGDTVLTLAQKFGVTSDSLRWSNNLLSDSLTPGSSVLVPPVNGIVYKVQVGDTVDMLAQKYSTTKDKITAFNDAEIKGLAVGTNIVIPDGIKAAPITAAQIARAAPTAAALAWGGAPIYGYNGYDYGYCTWYVANRISVPANWGDAHTWDNSAAASGWNVSNTPHPGSIAESDRGAFGHVAYVEAVSPDGTMIKYSDMNGLAGFGRVGYSDWTPIAHFSHYISH